MASAATKFVWVCVVPQVLLINVNVALFIMTSVRGSTLAVVSNGFELLWMLSALVFIGFDSRERWPGQTFMGRISKALTFSRD